MSGHVDQARAVADAPLSRLSSPKLRRGAPAQHSARFALSNAILLALALLVSFFAFKSSVFLTVDNLRDIMVQMSTLAVVAVPMTYLIIAGYLDLSVGSTLAVSGVVAGQVMTSGSSPLTAVLLAVGVGAGLGLLNGVAIAVLGFSTIIVTLGTLTLGRGLALAIGPRPLFGFPVEFTSLGQAALWGVPSLVGVAATVLAAGWIVLVRTPFGRHVFAVGVNKRAAYLSGVRVRRVGLLLFVASGTASGIAAVMEVSRLASAPSDSLGSGFEIDVLTAVLLGGVAFTGGRGSLVKVLLGILFLGVLRNGLILLNVPLSWSLVIKGVALIVAAGLAVLSARLGGRDG